MERRRETVSLQPGCEPLDLPGRGADSTAAALLLHGINSHPRQLIDLAEPLARAGFRVVAPLLRGHGTHPRDLLGVTWHDWYRDVERIYDALKKRHEPVLVVGFSLGAALGLELAASRDVDGLVLLAAPIRTFVRFIPRGAALWLLDRVAPFVPTFAKRIYDETGRRVPTGVYRRMPVETLHTLRDLVRSNCLRLSRVTAPTLIVHPTADFTARRRGGLILADELGSADKRVVWVETRNHEITRFEKKDYVIERVLAFASERVPARSHAV